MKKLVVFAMLLVMASSLTGCGGPGPNTTPPPPPPPGTPGGDEDPNGGVGFDDPTVGKDGQ